MSLTLICGDALTELRRLPSDSVHCCVTSPPYWGLRDYGIDGQIGLEPTLDGFLDRLVSVFDEVRRVLHPSGVCFVNMGDSYAGGGNYRGCDESTLSDKQRSNHGAHGQLAIGRTGVLPPTVAIVKDGTLKAKNRCLIPFRLALTLQASGWWVRDVIAWTKPAPMPESVTDRCTQSWEPILMLTKSARYFWDAEAVREPLSDATAQRDKTPRGRSQNGGGSMESISGYDYSRDGLGDMQSNPAGRNLRNVWSIGPEDKPKGHYATFPSELPRKCILAATSARGVCQGCGEPWVRQVEKTMPPLRSVNGTGPHGEHGLLGGARFDDPIQTRTVGWQRGCECGAGEPVSATVLDIFAGTGTTCAVALDLGRSAIGIELNPDYVKLAECRCAAITPGLQLA
jgi:DNA modification methylase